MSEELGFISYRNEDGTSWFISITSATRYCSGEYRFRNAFPRSTFDMLTATEADSRKNDCPDNGFSGLYNLKFTPCTQAEADAQALANKQWDETGYLEDELIEATDEEMEEFEREADEDMAELEADPGYRAWVDDLLSGKWEADDYSTGRVGEAW